MFHHKWCLRPRSTGQCRLQCSAVQCIAGKCSAGQCSAQCSAVQCSTVQHPEQELSGPMLPVAPEGTGVEEGAVGVQGGDHDVGHLEDGGTTATAGTEEFQDLKYSASSFCHRISVLLLQN